MKESKNNSVILAIYNHPEQYPPTRNAAIELSKHFQKVFLHFRPNFKNESNYPEGVFLSKWKSDEPQNPQLPSKFLWFFRFTYQFLRIARKNQPDWIIVHDHMALLSLHWVLFFYKTDSKLWYHNHDIPDKNSIRKYSLGWVAMNITTKVFPKLDLFTLPSIERKPAFPMHLLRGNFFHIPNYPMFDLQGPVPSRPEGKVKIIFQGVVTANRGIEELIPILKDKVKSNNLSLTLYGRIDKEFEPELLKLIYNNRVQDKVHLAGAIPYQKLLEETPKFHIGLATMKPQGTIYQTAGTASNKIYEYAKAGLTVIYFDTEHYNQYLKTFDWTVSTDLSPTNFKKAIEQLITDWPSKSQSAQADFQSRLNFQANFSSAIDYLKSHK